MMKSQTKMLEMQMQIRQNATELSDYLHDLDMWENDIKKQDKTFSKMKPKLESKLITPIRGNSTTKSDKIENFSKEKPKRIKSYDFKSWDKLDVDKMMKDIDAEEEQNQIQNEEKSKNDLKKLSDLEKNKSHIHKIQRQKNKIPSYFQKLENFDQSFKQNKESSVVLYHMGNNYFKVGQYDKSIDCYTKGMQCDPTNAILPANRAMAYLKLKRYVECETDSTLALSLDPVYVKAYLRRGSARKALGKVESAIKDFNDVLKLEPDNRQAKQELESMKKEADQDFKKAINIDKSLKYGKRRSCIVTPIDKPVHLQSKKPLRRITVVEVGSCDAKIISEVNEKISSCHDEEFNIKSSSSHMILENNGNKPVSKITNVFEKTNKQLSNIGNEDSPPIFLYPPTTCFQFQADIRKLKSCPNDLFNYLLSLEVDRIPTLLKEQLDTDMLFNIINCFLHCLHKNEEFVIEFLQSLSKARRFDMAVLFFSANDKKIVRSLYEKLIQNHDKSKMTKLFSKYGVN